MPRFVIILILGCAVLLTAAVIGRYNPVTAEVQFVTMSAAEEKELGLRAAGHVIAQYGGMAADADRQGLVRTVGRRLVTNTSVVRAPYQFEFAVLHDDSTANAFALPGGQIFITAGLLERLDTEGELAGVLSHEIGHVVARHSAEQLIKMQLIQSLARKANAGDQETNGSTTTQGRGPGVLLGQFIRHDFYRADELESDRLAVRFMAEAGYDPRALLGVMAVMEAVEGTNLRSDQSSSTHPSPRQRAEHLRAIIQSSFPDGVPETLLP